ncbi:MAG: nitric oxide reductase [Magnetococcales bacterium]|nr:nitric oxide reductase [Magnetococcales bacterium]
MEEFIGRLWDRFITRRSGKGHPEATITLDQVACSTRVLFRALEGDPHVRIQGVADSRHDSGRTIWARLAGNGYLAPLAWLDPTTLHMPARIELFPSQEENRNLYLWLAALAAITSRYPPQLGEPRHVCVATLFAHAPGLRALYAKLVDAHLRQRPDPENLTPAAAKNERMIRDALQHPERVAGQIPPHHQWPAPVPLWLHPNPPASAEERPTPVDPNAPPPESPDKSLDGRGLLRQATSITPPSRGGGLLLHRFESILGQAEAVSIDRTDEETEDLDEALRAADDLERLQLARSRRQRAKRIRFDLDLPSEAADDLPLGPGISLPEWHERLAILQPDHCRLQTLVADRAPPMPLPAELRAAARQLRHRFESLRPEQHWRPRQWDGMELDLDAIIERRCAQRQGRGVIEQPLYRALHPGHRDLACLLLADLSLSTGAHVDDRYRIIDIIRHALWLFSEALATVGDRFALYGFSSCRRHNIRFHHLKGFRETYDDTIRGRIGAIRPGYYTRMGAAIRHASNLLEQANPAQAAEIADHLSRAGELLAQCPTRRDRAALPFSWARLALLKGEKEEARRRFQEAITLWSHPDNPARAELAKLDKPA